MKNRNWFWGILFLLLGVFVVASQTDAFQKIGFLTYLLAALLVSLIIQSIFSRNFFGIFVPMVFIYNLFQQPLSLPSISIWVLLAAAVLTSIGFSILFKVRPKNIVNIESHSFNQTKESLDDNSPYAKVSFGASSKYLHGNNINKGQFIASFGALEVYFDQAQLSPEGAEIYIDCSFGAVKLFVPKTWRVTDNLHVSLGGVDNHCKSGSPAENAPHLNLVGNVQLGGVEIEYI